MFVCWEKSVKQSAERTNHSASAIIDVKIILTNHEPARQSSHLNYELFVKQTFNQIKVRLDIQYKAHFFASCEESISQLPSYSQLHITTDNKMFFYTCQMLSWIAIVDTILRNVVIFFLNGIMHILKMLHFVVEMSKPCIGVCQKSEMFRRAQKKRSLLSSQDNAAWCIGYKSNWYAKFCQL